MRLLDEHNAAAYLRETGRVGADEPLDVQFLSGGVSNVVLYVRRPASPDGDFVLKQARAQLRVPQPWFCSVERIWREVAVLRLCERLLAAPDERTGTVVHLPRILFEDRDQYAFGMTAAPLGHATWKQQLLAGEVRADIAGACGRLLGRLHASTWEEPQVSRDLEDRQFFDDLRLDPYYRQVARVHADLARPIDELLASVECHRRALVHGDFSPKNLLVWPGGLMLIDCEVGHFGDPAFDLGFFLTHLVLKSLHFTARFDEYFALTTEFWTDYRNTLAVRIGDEEWRALEGRAQRNLAGCLLARVDGKSRVEYLTRAAPIRAVARSLLLEPSASWLETAARIRLTHSLLKE